MNETALMHILFGQQPCLVNVVDIGAGQYDQTLAPYDSLLQAGHARVVGFEPNLDRCASLNQKYGAPHLFLPHFVGDGKPATFYETNWPPTGSLFRPNRPMLEAFQNLHELTTLKAEHPVATKRLDDLSELGDVDFVKIDVQGSELAVFEGGEQLVRNAVLVQTEVLFVEAYEKQPLFGDLDRLLRSYGYQFHTFQGMEGRCFKPLVANNNINQPLRQVLWADAIYVKDWLRLDNVSLDKMKKLALLLHEVVRSFDLCHLVLHAIDARTGSNFAPQYLQTLLSASPKRDK